MVSSWHPKWREETGQRHKEVLACLALPTVVERRRFLAMIEERHGLEERVALENAITLTWELRRRLAQAWEAERKQESESLQEV